MEARVAVWSHPAAQYVIKEKECILEPRVTSQAMALHLVEGFQSTGNATAKWFIQEPGLYDLVFANCHPGTPSTSFKAGMKFYNPGPDYLSVGEAPLPWIYLLSALGFATMAGVWVWALRTAPVGKAVTMHYFMLALLVFKALAALFEGIMFHFISVVGHSTGWSVVWYILNFFKGMLTFTVILVVGTGYSLLKPALNLREKYTVAAVLALQVLNNIAIIVVWEGQPGSLVTGTWTDLLHIVDIVCCAAVLFPIAWSLKNLQVAAAADGKAARALVRLQQFRAFYLYVIVYVYLSRIVVFIMTATLGYQLTWLAPAFAEAFAAAFYLAVGFKFRPEADNPYLQLPTEDGDGEFGLGDADELQEDAAPRPPAAAASIELPQIPADVEAGPRAGKGALAD